MPTIYFHLLSIPDAEDAIAEAWNILEEYDIPSPSMTFTFRSSSRVNIALGVDDPVDAQTLMLRLARWISSQTAGMVLPEEKQPTRSPHVSLSSVASSRFLNSGHDRHRRPHPALSAHFRGRFRHSALLIAGYFGFSRLVLTLEPWVGEI